MIREEVGSCLDCGIAAAAGFDDNVLPDDVADEAAAEPSPTGAGRTVPCPFCADSVPLDVPGATGCPGCGNAFTVDEDFVPVGEPVACESCGAGFLADLETDPVCPRCGEPVSLDSPHEYVVSKVVCPRNGELCYIEGPEDTPCPVCGILG